MSRFSPLQLLLLAFGIGLMLSAVFLDQIVSRWDKFMYPNAVYWQGMRVVPGKTQQINAPREDMLVVKDQREPMARLTLFLRPDDGVSPQKLIRDLCSRDACRSVKVESDGADRAAANYRNNGESMQIQVIRLAGGNVWVEFKGPPEAFGSFNALIESVSAQIEAATRKERVSVRSERTRLRRA